MAKNSAHITQLLASVGRGDESAREILWSLVYDELRRIARRQMSQESPGRTLQPTALIHEAYLRLTGAEGDGLNNRIQFFAAAAKVMRRIRVDDARMRRRLKRGGGAARVALDAADGSDRADVLACFDDDPTEALALNEALSRLEQIDPRAAELVVLRFHGGLRREEIGEALGIAPRTVDQLWSFARAWLHHELHDARDDG